MVNGWIKNRLLSGYPLSCVLCGAKGGYGLDLCIGCAKDLQRLQNPCYCCGLPLTGADQSLCGNCLKKMPHFDRTFCGYTYQPPFNLFIQRMKFSGSLQFISLLSALHAAFVLDKAGPLPELMIPVPLHRARMRERGFNQALELTKQLSRQLSLPYSNKLCWRHRAVPSQRGLTAKQRRSNLRNAFTIAPLTGVKHIALIDDVMTTGSTLEAIASVLKSAGAARVSGLVVARAVL